MPSIAVVGASNNPEKYGNRCVRAYLRAGWTVYPINPREKQIEGLDVYRTIADIPAPIDRVSLYVGPEVVAPMLDAFVAAGVGEIYFNPGTEDLAVMDRAREMGLKVHEACALVALALGK